ncbi:hypothetical protein ASF43_26760 [Pseudorhodoferax sp. Leaf267]|nr:hypothetical protein ASF43_26760 [Pseudorhodoferax sp. Leaf267]
MLALATGTVAVHSRQPASPVELDQIALVELPAQGRQTYQLILQGGPFPYEKDGTVFGNRERLLPAQRRGYYREYTVAHAGARNRGARRIVCGGLRPTVPDGCYYTSDHYASFRKIVH